MGPAQSTQQDHGGGQAQDTTERQLPPHIQLQQLQQQLLQLQLEFQQRQQVEQLQQQQQQQPLETEAGSSSTSSQDSPISPGAAGSAMDAASGGGGGEASQPSDPATNRVVLISLMEDVARWSATLERVLECPVCTETMRSPIVLCAGGHSLCGRCGSSCRECPVCRARLVSGRNYLLEELLRLCTDTLPDFEQLENIVTTLAVSEQVTKTEGADPTLEDWAAILSVMDADKILPQTQPLPPTGLQVQTASEGAIAGREEDRELPTFANDVHSETIDQREEEWFSMSDEGDVGTIEEESPNDRVITSSEIGNSTGGDCLTSAFEGEEDDRSAEEWENQWLPEETEYEYQESAEEYEDWLPEAPQEEDELSSGFSDNVETRSLQDAFEAEGDVGLSEDDEEEWLQNDAEETEVADEGGGGEEEWLTEAEEEWLTDSDEYEESLEDAEEAKVAEVGGEEKNELLMEGEEEWLTDSDDYEASSDADDEN